MPDKASATHAAPKGPLSGLRVIDWTVWQLGPVASAMLGDLGAEVIKIEERERGDGGRAMFVHPDDGSSPFWEMMNRNKKSVAVDLKNPEGLELVRKLIDGADIFIQNFRPSVADKIGLGYDALRARNPRLIYAAASAFGPEGAEGKARAYDLLGQARSGLLMIEPGREEPGFTDGGLADQMGAIGLAYGVLAAVVARERLGVGQRVDASMFGSMLWLRGLPLAIALRTAQGSATVSPVSKHRQNKGAYSRKEPGNPLWNTFKCGDGKWLAMAILQSDPHWQTVLTALGNPAELANDQRFASHLARCDHSAECTEILDNVFASQPRDYWLEQLTTKGDLPVCAINTTAEAAADPMAWQNAYVTKVDHPTYGAFDTPGFPVSLSETPARIQSHAPAFGAHTEEVLIDLLGLDWDEIGALRERKVI